MRNQLYNYEQLDNLKAKMVIKTNVPIIKKFRYKTYKKQTISN